MHRTSTTLMILAVAGMLLAGMPASAIARPLDVEWQNDAKHPGEYQLLVVDPTTGDILAMTSPSSDAQVVRRLDGRTGEVEWTMGVNGMSHLALDRSSGRVVLAGSGADGLRLTVLRGDGAVVLDMLTAVTVQLIELVVDPVTGQICTLGPQGRSNTTKTWVTSCWAAKGTAVFSRAWSPPDGQSQPSALGVDPRSHRVYVAGTSRPYERHTGRRQDVVLLAYDSTAPLLWQDRSRGAVFLSYFSMALDHERHRIHLLGDPAVINSPMRLFSFDSEGHKRFSTGWRDPESSYDTALAVTSSGCVLAVSAGSRRATLRSYAGSGRLLGSEVVRVVDRDSEGTLQKVAIDPRRRRAHVLASSGWSEHMARVHSFTFDGQRLSRTVVDRRKDVSLAAILVHRASGRVYAATTPWRPGNQRITALDD
jgi:hypothetical protein